MSHGLTADELKIKQLEEENMILRIVADRLMHEYWSHIRYPSNHASDRRAKLNRIYNETKMLMDLKLTETTK